MANKNKQITYNGPSYTKLSYQKMPEYQVSQFSESADTQNFRNMLNNIQANAPAAYQKSQAGTFQQGVMDKIMNRDKFNYDFNTDQLYQQYKDNYTKMGNEAAINAATNAAALSGGYGSSYAATAGAQANQQYLTQLNQMIPQLANLAMDKYRMEGEDLYNQYYMLGDAEQRNYDQWMDSQNLYRADRDFAYNGMADSRNYDLNKWSSLESALANAYGLNQNERHYASDFEQAENQFGYNYALNAAQYEQQKAQWAAEYALKQAAAAKAGKASAGTGTGNQTIQEKAITNDEGKYGVQKVDENHYAQVGTDPNGNPIRIVYDKYGKPTNMSAIAALDYYNKGDADAKNQKKKK